MLDCGRMPPPNLVVSAGRELFESFFPPVQRGRLTRLFRWQQEGACKITPAFRRKLSTAQALITSWDSPYLSEDLPRVAPALRIIAHCGGEVKSRFARSLFDQLTITNAPAPMARAAAEMGAALLLYSARNVDFYRDAVRSRSNRIYQQIHLHGAGESLIGREVAMIGFGRIGRALVTLMGGFDLRWLVYDPYVPGQVRKNYPVRFTSLESLLPRAQLLMLTAALTEESRGLLSRDRLALLPDGAVVINIARGGLLDLRALTREVERQRLRCALDVTDPFEPLPIGHPLRALPGAIVTPHIAASHWKVRHEMAEAVIDDLQNFFKHGRVNHRVTASMLDRMT
jgi:phosphoglycerate dehydrogenase-like enzyme